MAYSTQCLHQIIQPILQDALHAFVLLERNHLEQQAKTQADWLATINTNCQGGMPLTRVFASDTTPIVSYVSAIALQLQGQFSVPVDWIAAQIINYFVRSLNQAQEESVSTIPQPLWLQMREIIPQQLPSGLIQCKLSERGIAAWLEYWNQELPLLLASVPHLQSGNASDAASHHSTSSLFAAQHSHARACSLLQRAYQAGRVDFKGSPATAAGKDFGKVAGWAAIAEIPWLTEAGQLTLIHPAEQQLLSQGLETLEILADSSIAMDAIAALKLATHLSDAFQAFHRHCRMWGSIQQENPTLVKARLGLVSIVRATLYVLLVGKLHAPAPAQL